MNKTCADCIHYEVCQEFEKALDENAIGMVWNSSEEICDSFADKSRYIELPCVVGDMVYMRFEGEVINFSVTRATAEIKADERNLYYDAKNESVSTCFTPNHINKTIFLTKKGSGTGFVKKGR